MVYQAVWNGVVIAESDSTVKVEGNHYFPAASLRREYFTESLSRTLCPWKGLASYYTIEVDGKINPDAAWYYRKPSPLARRITDHVAFWQGVRVRRVDSEVLATAEHRRSGLLRRLLIH